MRLQTGCAGQNAFGVFTFSAVVMIPVDHAAALFFADIDGQGVAGFVEAPSLEAIEQMQNGGLRAIALTERPDERLVG